MFIREASDQSILVATIICIVALMGGCASTPDEELKEVASPVFYPPAPNPPRIQFLTSFSGAADIEKDKKGSFARFVLGEEKKRVPVLVKPYGVALHDGTLNVVDAGRGGYSIFDLKNQTYDEIFGINKPINITIDTDGSKYVTDTDRKLIHVFDKRDRRIKTFGTQGEYKPTDVAIVADKLFVADIENQLIRVLEKDTGQLIFTIGSAGSSEGQFIHPTNLAVGENGNIYVSDTGNFRVQEFTADGRFVRRLGEIGTSMGKFARPKGIALDKEGRIYIVDAAFQNVQVFDKDGQLLMDFAGAGVGPGGLYLPADISIDYTSVSYFQSYAAPGFQLEYVILVTNQFGPNKVNVYGFGKSQGVDYP